MLVGVIVSPINLAPQCFDERVLRKLEVGVHPSPLLEKQFKILANPHALVF